MANFSLLLLIVVCAHNNSERRTQKLKNIPEKERDSKKNKPVRTSFTSEKVIEMEQQCLEIEDEQNLNNKEFFKRTLTISSKYKVYPIESKTKEGQNVKEITKKTTLLRTPLQDLSNQQQQIPVQPSKKRRITTEIQRAKPPFTIWSPPSNDFDNPTAITPPTTPTSDDPGEEPVVYVLVDNCTLQSVWQHSLTFTKNYNYGPPPAYEEEGIHDMNSVIKQQ